MFPYIGSKKFFEKKYHLSDYIPDSGDHYNFCSPFCGSCAVELQYLNRNSKKQFAILNDINTELINFINIIRKKHEEFKEKIYHVQMVKDIDQIEFDLNDPVEKAIKFYLPNMNNTQFTKPVQLRKDFSEITEILNRNSVIICNDPWEKFIEYTSGLQKRQIYFCDPPYAGTKGHAKINGDKCYNIKDFNEKTFFSTCIELAEKGHEFFITYKYDEDLIKMLKEHGWYVMIMENTIAPNTSKITHEIFISNKPFTKYNAKNLTNFIKQ